MVKKRKILYVSGTRADYGLIKEVLFAIKKNPRLDVKIVATGMHLMPEFGKTIEEIKKDGFKACLVKAVYKKDDRSSAINFLGDFIPGLLKEAKKMKPDIIFIQGDRTEMLGGAIVGAYLGIPVVHSHGGEVTSTVDEIARHAITKLSHVHLTTTKKSKERILKMGEDPWRVHLVGAPGLDTIFKKKLFPEKEIAKDYGLTLSKPIVLVLQHPVTAEIEEAAGQMKETMEAIKTLKEQTIVIYPSADAGARKMIKVIEKYKKYPFVSVYRTVPYKDYLSLMKIASVLVGNSSSGIIEAPSFGLPTVNIGTRQEGRERAGNVIEVGYRKEEIEKAIEKAIYDKKFRQKVKKNKNPYGDGKASTRIVKILTELKIDKKLLQKKIAY